jgi:hypothetical protein
VSDALLLSIGATVSNDIEADDDVGGHDSDFFRQRRLRSVANKADSSSRLHSLCDE